MTRRAGHFVGHTPEPAWQDRLEAAPLPALTLPAPGRAAVLSAHPDDDVLAVAGLVVSLARHGWDVRFTVATDGEASHGDDADRTALAARRRGETAAALAALDLPYAQVHRPGLPDGGLRGDGRLHDVVADAVHGADLVLCPWRHDGHPDHEAVGEAVLDVENGQEVWQYPVWAWHWAEPASSAIDWSTARAHHLDEITQARKERAVRCFGSQLETTPRHDPVLPEPFLEHFRRDVEVVFT